MSPTLCRQIRPSLFLIAVTSLHPAAPAVGADEPVPKDFRVVATYGPGGGYWFPWETTITADGKAVRKEITGKHDERDREKTFTLSPGEVRAMASRIEKSRFTKLKKYYDYPITDGQTLVLRVTRNGETHEVGVYAPSDQMDNAEVRLFLSVWAEVLTKIPSPNREQTPDLYRP